MASYPSYNLNSFVTGLSNAQYTTLRNEGGFNNYAIQGLYTPGSTFKLITATAALQTGIFPADKYIDDTGVFKVPDCKRAPGSICSFHDDDNSAAGEIDLPRPSPCRRTTTSTTSGISFGPRRPAMARRRFKTSPQSTD